MWLLGTVTVENRAVSISFLYLTESNNNIQVWNDMRVNK